MKKFIEEILHNHHNVIDPLFDKYSISNDCDKSKKLNKTLIDSILEICKQILAKSNELIKSRGLIKTKDGNYNKPLTKGDDFYLFVRDLAKHILDQKEVDCLHFGKEYMVYLYERYGHILILLSGVKPNNEPKKKFN